MPSEASGTDSSGVFLIQESLDVGIALGCRSHVSERAQVVIVQSRVIDPDARRASRLEISEITHSLMKLNALIEIGFVRRYAHHSASMHKSAQECIRVHNRQNLNQIGPTRDQAERRDRSQPLSPTPNSGKQSAPRLTLLVNLHFPLSVVQ